MNSEIENQANITGSTKQFELSKEHYNRFFNPIYAVRIFFIMLMLLTILTLFQSEDLNKDVVTLKVTVIVSFLLYLIAEPLSNLFKPQGKIYNYLMNKEGYLELTETQFRLVTSSKSNGIEEVERAKILALDLYESKMQEGTVHLVIAYQYKHPKTINKEYTEFLNVFLSEEGVANFKDSIEQQVDLATKLKIC